MHKYAKMRIGVLENNRNYAILGALKRALAGADSGHALGAGFIFRSNAGPAGEKLGTVPWLTMESCRL